MTNTAEFLEGRLHLKVNQDKSAVASVWERSFLGYRLLPGGTLALAPKSLKRAKERLRQITRRNRGVSLNRVISDVNSFSTGWVTYFRMARCKTHLIRLDEWIRARLRCFRIKQCKRIKSIVDFLKRQGVPTKRARRGGASSKGWWRTANCPPVKEAMPISWFATMGLMSMAERYATLQFSENRRGT